MSEKKGKIKIGVIIGRIVILLAVTIVALLAAVFSVLLVLNYGPSERAHRVFVKSVRETSAIGFLADWFTTPEELAEINKQNVISEFTEISDSSLIHIPTQAPSAAVTEAPHEPEIIYEYPENGWTSEELTPEESVIQIEIDGQTRTIRQLTCPYQNLNTDYDELVEMGFGLSG